MSKMTKLTKAVPAKKAVASKNAVNSRYFTTPTVGDWAEDMDGIDELLAEFYIQSRDISGSGVVDPINIAKLLNMVGLNAVVVSGVNNEDYLIRRAFTGSDVCGNILLDNITSKFIARNPDVINQLLDIELAYNGNNPSELSNSPKKLFPSVVDIAAHSARGALGAINTWTVKGKDIRIDASKLNTAAQKALELYMKSFVGVEGGYENEGDALKDFILLTTITDEEGEETITGEIDASVFGAKAQILTDVPLDEVTGISVYPNDGKLSLSDANTGVMNGSETYHTRFAKPSNGSNYWGRLTVAYFFFDNDKILEWIVDNITSEAELLLVLDDFNTISEGYVYDELTLEERVEVLSAKSTTVLVHVLNDEDDVKDLVSLIVEYKSITALQSVGGLPTNTRPIVNAASEDDRKFFAALADVVGKKTRTERLLSYNDLEGSEYAALFYYTRNATSGVITIKSKVTTIYTAGDFTQYEQNLSDDNVALLREEIGLNDSDALAISIGALPDSSNVTDAQGELVTLFNNFGATEVFKVVVTTSTTSNWNYGKTVLELYLTIVGSDNTDLADSMLRHVADAMEEIKVRTNKTTVQSLFDASPSDALKRGMLRLLDHGAEATDIFNLLGSTEIKRRANVVELTKLVTTAANGGVDRRKVNELIQLAGIQTFSTNNGKMNNTASANMFQNWALAFADTDVEMYGELRKAGFLAWELLTYTRTTNVYKVVNGRAVRGVDETTMAFNVDLVCEAYEITLEQLAKEAYENYGITLAIEEEAI